MDKEIAQLMEALQFSPENIPLRYHVARVFYNNGDYHSAISQLEEILRRSADHSEAKFKLAQACFQLNEYSKAVVILEGLIDDGQENEDILLLYARTLLNEGNLSDAQHFYEKALSINPNVKDEELDSQFRVSVQQPINDDDEFDEEGPSPTEFRPTTGLLEKSSVNFSDVGGMDAVKKEIGLKIIKPLLHKSLYEAYGKKIGGGILLYGPPGCGKTHIAKATAGEIEASFINVGINDVLDMWMGNSEKNLHHLFETARRNAPCVLFFDEIDAIGASRSDMRQSAGRQLINQFLAELDGIGADNDGVLVMGATNTPWHLDQAFRRPGRFDRIIFVAPPDLDSRKSILEILLKDKPAQSLSLDKVASKTKDFSGADLRAVVDIAIEKKLEASFQTGVPEPLQTKDLLYGAKKHLPSTKEWFNTARNFAVYANESGLYDDVLDYLKIKRP